MENEKFKPKAMGIFESIFDIAYLIFDLIAVVIFLAKGSGNQLALLYALMTFLLGFGDSFHLIPRVKMHLKGRNENTEKELGLGLLISSISMTVFYLVLFQIYKILYPRVAISSALVVLLFLAATFRIIVCLFPQNNWFHKEGNKTFSIARNVPFAIVGVIMIIFYIMAKDYAMACAIFVSFLCYIPVTIWAKKKPAIGALMLPKTLAYVAIICMGIVKIV